MVNQQRHADSSNLNQSIRFDVDAWKSVLLHKHSPVTALTTKFRPRGPGSCDHNSVERWANLLTCAPIIASGYHTLRARRSKQAQRFGASIIAVAACSALFHAAKGRAWKSFGRKADYWSIGVATTLLVNAVWEGVPRPITIVSLAATPFRPFAVSAVNAAAAEFEFLRRSMKHPELRSHHMLHSAAAVAGLGCFSLEEWKPELPLVHAAWHCFAGIGIATVNHLLHHVELHPPSPRTRRVQARAVVPV